MKLIILCALVAASFGCEASTHVEGSKVGLGREVKVSGPDATWTHESIIIIGPVAPNKSESPNP